MLPFLKPLIDSTTSGLDKLFTSDEERLKAQAQLKELEVKIETSLNEHMTEVVKAQRSVLEKELTHGSWIAKNWRPMLMVFFMACMVYPYLVYPLLKLIQVSFNCNFWLPLWPELPSQMWTLLQIGVGGYVVGRSGEKIADKFKK